MKYLDVLNKKAGSGMRTGFLYYIWESIVLKYYLKSGVL